MLTAAWVTVSYAQTDRKPITLVITGGTVITMDARWRILSPGAVAISGTDIVAVDTPEQIKLRFRARDTIEVPESIVMPGLVNTHTHAPTALYRGLADDRAPKEWLDKYIFPAEQKTLSPEFVRAGARLAALEMIQSGTTTFADMYYFEGDIAVEVKAAGLRAVLGQTIIQVPIGDVPNPEEGLARAEAFIKAWRNDPLISPAVAPHAIYTVDAPLLVACRELSKRYEVATLIHVSETKLEVQTSKERYGVPPVAYLDSLGFLGPGVLVAHGIWVSEGEIATLRARGVAVSHNPESNMKLASGVAPIPAYLKAGVTVGLGTDGPASNNDLDMFEAMRVASLLAKVHSGDPEAVSARTALEMATMGGARALGLERKIGSLEPGKSADVIAVAVNRARQTPLYDPISHLVYTTRGDDVHLTVVNGRVLMRGRKVLTMDEHRVLSEARLMSKRVKAAVSRAAPVNSAPVPNR